MEYWINLISYALIYISIGGCLGYLTAKVKRHQKYLNQLEKEIIDLNYLTRHYGLVESNYEKLSNENQRVKDILQHHIELIDQLMTDVYKKDVPVVIPEVQ